jgi:hypothetical protein
MESVNIRGLATEVATALGDGWSVDPEWDCNGSMIDHTDGRRLHVHKPWNKDGFVAVNGVYPHPTAFYFRPEDRFEINVRADRGAEVIAREINRRLMSDYAEVLAKVKAADEQHRDAYAKREAFTARVYAVLGKPQPVHEVPEWEQERRRMDTSTDISLHGLLDGYGSIKVSHDATSASIEIHSIPAEKVLEVLKLLARS